MAKTDFIQIRCTPDDRERMARVAAVEHLELSTWARQTLLNATERAESRRIMRVAEGPPKPAPRRK